MIAKKKSYSRFTKPQAEKVQLSLFEENFEKALNETDLAELQFEQRPAANTEEYKVWLRQIINRAIKNLD